MGAASSGGSDNQVSGAEAVYTGGTTYSSRQITKVNKQIAEQNKRNRESRQSPITKAIKSGGVTGKIISSLTGDAAKKANLKRRKDFIKKQGLTSDDIRMDDDYLSSAEGLKELKAQGYTTVADTSQDTRSGDQQIQPAKVEPEPIIVKKNIGGTEVQTTDVKLAEEKKKKEEAEDEYDARRTKRRGRRMTILTSQTGAGGNLVLGKPTLLGA
tara:strand:- start:59 stop:697 length:639 start_codon:yes stop_codon:yes gene_type:complete